MYCVGMLEFPKYILGLPFSNEKEANVISTEEPTYWPSDPKKTPDLIDLFINKRMSRLYTKMESRL